MIIPVEVQQPNKPWSTRMVGSASDQLTAKQVAEKVGVPEGCLIDGKVMRRMGKARWSLVVNVRFGEPK
jgi:hypothetical protein